MKHDLKLKKNFSMLITNLLLRLHILLFCSMTFPAMSNAQNMQIPENVKFFGYFGADTVDVMKQVSNQTNLVIMGWPTEERMQLAKSLNKKVFVHLEDYLFYRDSNGKSIVHSRDNRINNWKNKALPWMKKYADIIEAFVPVDEPEFRTMGDALSYEPRSVLEDIANMIRQDLPQAKLAVNFWYETVLTGRIDYFLPRNYNYMGTEQYSGEFSPEIYDILSNKTAAFQPQPSIYLVPKAFLAEVKPGSILEFLPNELKPFYQPDGEVGLIKYHFEKMLEYAKTHPRVTAVLPFVWGRLVEGDTIINGIQNFSLASSWMNSFGRSVIGKNPEINSATAPQPQTQPVAPTPSPPSTPLPPTAPPSTPSNPGSSCQGVSSVLMPGHSLLNNQYRCSSNGAYKLAMINGNLILTRTSDSYQIWTSSSANSGGFKATMKHNGNFEILRANNQTVFKRMTNYPNAKLEILNDGSVVFKENSMNFMVGTLNF